MKKKKQPPISIKRVISFFASVLIAFPLLPSQFSLSKIYASEVVNISTCLEFQNMTATDSDHKIFRLTDNIDCIATSISDTNNVNYVADLYNDGAGFSPIGILNFAVFDGQGFTISNLTINRPDDGQVAPFGSIFKSLIADVNFENVNITGGQYVGGLIGNVSSSDIIDVHVTGEVNSTLANTGGIAGNLDYQATISRSSFVGSISATSNAVGGIAGAIVSNGSIEDSYADVDIESTSYSIGGLVGEMRYENIAIMNSYATGQASGFNSVGGLVGISNVSSSSPIQVIEDSFASVQLTSTNLRGGLIGAVQYEDQAINVINSFFDEDVAGTSTAVGLNGGAITVTAIAGNETPTYFYSASNEPLATWDFETVWNTTEGFPILSPNNIEADAPGVPENVTFSVMGNTMEITWEEPLTNGGFDFLDDSLYEFQFKESSDPWDYYIESSVLVNGNTYSGSPNPYDQDNPSITIKGLSVNTEYDVRIRTLGEYGLRSDWVTVSEFTDTPDSHTISTCEQLQSIGTDPDYRLIDNYTLTGNIDCSDTVNWNEGDGFEPIGYDNSEFFGQLDGAGFTISDLTINRDSGYSVGLFSQMRSTNAAVRNVKFTNVSIVGYENVGTVVGYADNGIFENIEISGSITGDHSVGGLAGYLDDAFVDNVYTAVELVGSSYVGGLSGQVEDTEVNYASSLATIIPVDDYAEYLGGLIGNIEDSSIDNSSSNVEITIETSGNTISRVGGLVGESYYNVDIEDSYASGSIDITLNNPDYDYIEMIGGFIGSLCNDDPTCVIRRSSSSVDITINSGDTDEDNLLYISRVAGFIGSVEYFDDGLIEESYSTGDIQIDLVNHEGEIYHIGGFLGEINYDTEEALIRNNYTRSNITVNAGTLDVDNIAGFIGRNYSDYNLVVQNNYSQGDIAVTSTYEGFGDIGGFVGEDRDDSEEESETIFENNFRSGSLTINGVYVGEEVGGFVGRSNGIEANYSNNYLYHTGDFDYCFNESLGWGSGACTTVESANVFKAFGNQPIDSWNFNTIWELDSEMNDGFPILRMLGLDDDQDGISNEMEDAAPNGGDANGDEELDSEQDNVSSFMNPVTNSYTSFEVDPACTILSVGVNAEGDNAVNDSGFNYPVGMLNFTIECEPEFTTIVNVYEYGSTDTSLILRKYKDNGYFQVNDAVVTSFTLGESSGVVVNYSVTDGGVLDIDGEVNGVIIDPVGLATQSVGVPNTGIGGRR